MLFQGVDDSTILSVNLISPIRFPQSSATIGSDLWEGNCSWLPDGWPRFLLLHVAVLLRTFVLTTLLLPVKVLAFSKSLGLTLWGTSTSSMLSSSHRLSDV